MVRGARPMGRCAALGGALLAAVTALSACGCQRTEDSRPGPAGAAEPLPAGAVARVGRTLVSARAVAQIASQQHLSTRAAFDQATFDALLALEAQSDGSALTADARVASRGALARATLLALMQEASRSPITPAEIAEWTERRWLDVDRPEGYRTVHAVVLVDAKDGDDVRARARALAEQWHKALEPAAEAARRTRAPAIPAEQAFRTAPNDNADPAIPPFVKAVRAIDAGGLKTIVQGLDPVARDGRVMSDLSPGAAYLPEFAAAAATLAERGDLSPVTPSAVGFHVIMLLERISPRHLSDADKLAELRSSIVAARGKQAQDELRAKLHAASAGEVVPNADALLAQVVVEP